MSDIKRLRLYVNIPQSYVASIRKGTTAKFILPEYPGKTFTAVVQTMSQAINSNSGSMLVQLSAENSHGDLLPGGFATVSFEIPAASDRLSVPPSALVFTKTGVQVATVGADNKVALKQVVIARDYGSRIELLSGIAATDRVIENPPDGVMQGDLVQVATVEAKH